MNFVNPTVFGRSNIYIYDERTGGKGGNEVCSILWVNLISDMKGRAASTKQHPVHNVSALDSCTVHTILPKIPKNVAEEVAPFVTKTLQFVEKFDNSNDDLVDITSDDEEGKN